MARRIEQIKRNRKSRKTKGNILFEFEGKNKTEEIYFRNFQSRSNPYNLKFAYGNDTDPVSMVKSLISYMKKEDIGIENDDKIYCVIDADTDFNKQKKIDEAKKLASENGIEMIISTQTVDKVFLLTVFSFYLFCGNIIYITYDSKSNNFCLCLKQFFLRNYCFFFAFMV